jgi:hypothetical protein
MFRHVDSKRRPHMSDEQGSADTTIRVQALKRPKTAVSNTVYDIPVGQMENTPSKAR